MLSQLGVRNRHAIDDGGACQGGHSGILRRNEYGSDYPKLVCLAGKSGQAPRALQRKDYRLILHPVHTNPQAGRHRNVSTPLGRSAQAPLRRSAQACRGREWLRAASGIHVDVRLPRHVEVHEDRIETIHQSGSYHYQAVLAALIFAPAILDAMS